MGGRRNSLWSYTIVALEKKSLSFYSSFLKFQDNITFFSIIPLFIIYYALEIVWTLNKLYPYFYFIMLWKLFKHKIIFSWIILYSFHIEISHWEKFSRVTYFWPKIYDYIDQDLNLKERSSNGITNIKSPKIFRYKIMEGSLIFINNNSFER